MRLRWAIIGFLVGTALVAALYYGWLRNFLAW